MSLIRKRGRKRGRNLDRMADATIERAVVTPGHDGSAELLLTIRYDNGGRGDVSIDADAAARLFDCCGASHLDQLVGQSWRHLMHILEQPVLEQSVLEKSVLEQPGD